MNARIVKVNYHRARAVFERSDGEYGWFEILDTTEVEPDEEIFGDFSGLGGTTIKNQPARKLTSLLKIFAR